MCVEVLRVFFKGLDPSSNMLETRVAQGYKYGVSTITYKIQIKCYIC